MQKKCFLFCKTRFPINIFIYGNIQQREYSLKKRLLGDVQPRAFTFGIGLQIYLTHCLAHLV